jgi:hypothetical protein
MFLVFFVEEGRKVVSTFIHNIIFVLGPET